MPYCGYRAFAAALVGLAFLVVAGGQQPPPQTQPPPAQTPPAQTPPAQTAAPQTPAQPAPAPVNPNAPETTTRDEPATFKARVNLVMVPVVVRDKAGKAVGGLHQEDFQLFDKNKPQVITKFSAEKSGQRKVADEGEDKPKNEDQPLPVDMPERFVAYMFDDVHLQVGDLMRVRQAAMRHMETLLPTDRAAIFTTSTQVQMEFTDDRAKFRETLLRLMPRPLAGGGVPRCPDMTYYMADMISNHNDSLALDAATQETLGCNNMDPTDPGQVAQARQLAQQTARSEVITGSHESRVSLVVIRDTIRRMSAMPGQRLMILASPGFITPEQQEEKTEVLDRAIHANVIISSVDARGLWTDPTMDVSQRGNFSLQYLQTKQRYDRFAASAQADVLAELATGTGGNFFQNNNDLEAGFKQVASAPEYYYVLGFSPQNLKLDGAFHALKVTLKDPGPLTTQARRGYYAPKHLSDAEENAKEELREAIFSREEMHDLPVDLHTQFFKPTDDMAKVTVLMHVDLKRLRFRKSDGRSNNDLTIVSAVFDRNGNYVTGNQKLLEMHLKDETLERRADSGLTIRSTFDVKPGTYVIRLVVRDKEGQLMSAANGAVEIP